MISLRKSVPLFSVFVSVSSKSVFKNYLYAVYFCGALVVLGPFGLYKEFDNRYLKRPLSVTKKDISDHIYQSSYMFLGS